MKKLTPAQLQTAALVHFNLGADQGQLAAFAEYVYKHEFERLTLELAAHAELLRQIYDMQKLAHSMAEAIGMELQSEHKAFANDIEKVLAGSVDSMKSIEDVSYHVANVVGAATAAGYVVTVDQHSIGAPRMGGYRTRLEVREGIAMRKAREEAEQAAKKAAESSKVAA